MLVGKCVLSLAAFSGYTCISMTAWLGGSHSTQRTTVFDTIAAIRHHNQVDVEKGVFKLEHVVSKG